MKWVYLGLLIFIVLFITAIAINSIEWREKLKDYKERCDAVGGVMYVPKGVKGWPPMMCVDKSIFLLKPSWQVKHQSE